MADNRTKLLLTINEIASAIILTFETSPRAINKQMYSNSYDFLYLLHLWFIVYYIYGSGFHYIYDGYYIYGWRLLLHLWLVLLLFSNYWMRLSRMWRIMQIVEDIIGRGG